METKYGKTSSLGKHGANDNASDSESTSEDEDEDGELATEALDAEIMDTLNAIRSKDPRVYDQDVAFYSKFDDPNAAPKEKKEKPMTLHDYHRQNLLNGVDPAKEDDAPKTFAQEQAELKDDLVKQMHAAGEEDSGDEEMEDADDNFLIRKSGPADLPPAKPAAKLDVEHADQDPENFLSNFMSSRAWIPEGRSKLHAFDSDDDDEVDNAEAFEEAYNFRFEDPSKMNEKLVTHARDMTNKQSVRREDKSSRKKVRDAERQYKEDEKKDREVEKNRLRKLKVEELQKKVQQVKEVAGFRASELTDEDWARFLDDAWDDKQWEQEMEKRFGEEYYAEGGSGKNHPKKPEWDDDIDIKDLIPDYEDEGAKPTSDSEEDGEDAAEGSKKKSKAQEKREQRRDARKERLRIEEAVDRNMDLDITLLPGATKKNATQFRYRETSPQSFGLTARDILMANDSQLNEFAGLKKLASFRDEEKKARDQRKLGKKARLRQWRKDTFGNEEGPSFKVGPREDQNPEKDEDADEANVDIREGDGRRKKRKRSKKN